MEQGYNDVTITYFLTSIQKQYRINGDYYKMDTASKIINDRTYVPLRYLAEALGYEVSYDAIS